MSNVSQDLSYSFVWPGDYNWGKAASYSLPGPPLDSQASNLTAARLQESSTVLPTWLLSMWFMTTIHPPLSTYKQSTRKPIRTQQILEEKDNINLIVHNPPVPTFNQYADLTTENQIASIDGSGGVEVTTFRYPKVSTVYSWTNNEMKTYMPSNYASSLKTSEINDINNNLLLNPQLNEIPETHVNIKSTTTQRSLIDKQKDTFNDFNNILINSKLFKHFNTITSYSPPGSKNLTPKDVNNIMANPQNNMEYISPLNNTQFMEQFKNMDSASKGFRPSTKEFFGAVKSMPSKTTKNSNAFSDSIKPNNNELYSINNYGNKVNSNEQTFPSMESIMSPNVPSSFENNINTISKPISTETGNEMYFNMDTMPKPTPDTSSDMKLNMNNLQNNIFSSENMQSMMGPSSDNVNDMNYFVMNNNMNQEEINFKEKDVPSNNAFVDHLNTYLGNVNSMTPGHVTSMRDINPNTLTISNPVMRPNDVKILNSMANSNISTPPLKTYPAVSSSTKQNPNPNNNPNIDDWEKEFFNYNFTNNLMNIDLQKIKPQTKNENRTPSPQQPPSMPTFKSMSPSAMAQGNRSGLPPTAASQGMRSGMPPTAAGQGVRSVMPPTAAGQGMRSGMPSTAAGQGMRSGMPPTAAGQGMRSGMPPTAAGQGMRSGMPSTGGNQGMKSALPPTTAGQGMRSGILPITGTQGMKSGIDLTNSQTPSIQSNTGSGSPNTDQPKSVSPYFYNSGYPSHFQVFFRWKIMDLVFRDSQHKANLVRSNKFIPENNLPLGIAIWRNKIFVTFPKWKTGIPVTLASFNMDDPRESPLMAPYPNWSFFDDSNCNSLISVFRITVDKCDRLWVMDTGVIDIITSIQQVCPPKIMVFDLRTNTLIRRYILPTAQVFEGSLFSNIITELVEDCDHAFAYVNDVFRYGLIVYDFFKNTSYRLTHPYMYPEPTQSTYILDNLKFRWVDGIFGMAISPELSGKHKRHPYEYYHYNVHHYNGTNVDKTIRDDQRYLYFHSMSSNRHYYISTTDLRNSSRYVNSSDIDEYFHYLGQRHRNTQASAAAINSNGVMFYNLVTKHSVGCWNTRTKVYLPQTQDIVQTNRDILNFPNDLKIDFQDNIWVLSNKLHQYLYGFLDFNVFNYRILVANSNDIVRNTKCDPYLNLNDYLYNLHISSKQCPNIDLY